ncbi:MAG: winged helix-turn-helix domain-containing protein, partial [bacterium]|nr:winged helix-turn-helix domain-containing protein [bacterium]
NIFGSKEILRKVLKELFPRIKIIAFRCGDCLSGKSEDILEQIAKALVPNNMVFVNVNKTVEIIKEVCKSNIEKGLETVFVGDGLEDISEEELGKLLKALGSIVFTNRSRIHTILHAFNRPLLDKIFLFEPNTLSLAQNCEYFPLIKDSRLNQFIDDYCQKAGLKINIAEKKEVGRVFGGNLSLAIAYLRLKTQNQDLTVSGSISSPVIQTRIRSIWLRIAPTYQEIIKKIWQGLPVQGQLEANYLNDLLQLGLITKYKNTCRFSTEIFPLSLPILIKVEPLNIDKTKKQVCAGSINLSNVLTKQEERTLYQLIQDKGKLLTRDKIADAVCGKNALDKYSSWAIDQTVSRLRKKLVKLGYLKDIIKTYKGKGYRLET